MVKKLAIIAFTVLLLAGGCKNTESGDADAHKADPEAEKMVLAYAFLLEKLQEDNIIFIASEVDKNLNSIRDIIREEGLKLEVENYGNLEKRPDLCYYSKSTKKLVAVIDITKKSEDSYYVSYYLGPEGGASKEIQIEKKNGDWAIEYDDGMWIIK